jgi:hypothetical protein
MVDEHHDEAERISRREVALDELLPLRPTCSGTFANP